MGVGDHRNGRAEGKRTPERWSQTDLETKQIICTQVNINNTCVSAGVNCMICCSPLPLSLLAQFAVRFGEGE